MQSQRSSSVMSNKIIRSIKNHPKLWELLGIVSVFAFMPLILVVLTFLYVYRCLVKFVLRFQLKSKFAGLLAGSDSVWAADNTASLGIINILMILKNTTRSKDAVFLKNFKNLMNDRIVSKAAGTTCEKMFYRRRQKFGYCFWQKSEAVDLGSHIRWLECVDANCDGSCEDISSETFRRNLGSVSNRPLPYNNTATWECLVGKRCPTRSRSRVEEGRQSPEEHSNAEICDIPILFRAHHSLGDGVALMQLVFQEMSEKDGDEKDFKKIDPFLRNLETNRQNETRAVRSYLYAPYMLYRKIRKVARLTMILLSAPQCLIQQTICSMDENALQQGSPLTGEKELFYWLENDVDKSSKLLTKIYEIKKRTCARFEDIILAAFSASVHKYHLRINQPAPDALTAIIPVRITAFGENVTLDNKFSVDYRRVCISHANGKAITEPNQDSQFFQRLEDISRRHKKLREGSHILVNFWILKYLITIMPVKIIKIFLSNITFSTMGCSNIYGLQKARILDNVVSKIYFWIPNKDITALGFCILGYGNDLYLSLIADKCIVKKNRTLFKDILEDIVHEIDIAYNSITGI